MNKLIPTLLLVVIFSCQNKPVINADKIKIELDSIFVLDQMYREQMYPIYLEHGYDSKEFQEIMRKQEIIDSANLIYVENLIRDYGKYPGESLVGYSTGEVAFFVLQHAPDSIQSKYIDLILEASENNELKKGHVARFHDRYLISKGEPQIYGTQIGSEEVIDSLSGKKETINFLYPIRDTVKIDSVRLWNGLVPLEKYLNSFGLSRKNSMKFNM